MASTPTYRIITLPRDNLEGEPSPATLALAEKFRVLRLEALKTAPQAFTSSYDVEQRRGIEVALERMRNNRALPFIAVSISPDDAGEDDELSVLLRSDWVGMSALVAMQDQDTFSTKVADPVAPSVESVQAAATLAEPVTDAAVVAAAAAAAAASDVDDVLRFHIGGTFVSSRARKAGLGFRLMRLSLDRAAAVKRSTGKRVVVDIDVYEDNEDALRLYIRAGFKVVGKEVIAQHPRLIDGEMKSVDKVALHMEQEIS